MLIDKALKLDIVEIKPAGLPSVIAWLTAVLQYFKRKLTERGSRIRQCEQSETSTSYIKKQSSQKEVK